MVSPGGFRFLRFAYRRKGVLAALKGTHICFAFSVWSRSLSCGGKKDTASLFSFLDGNELPYFFHLSIEHGDTIAEFSGLGR